MQSSTHRRDNSYISLGERRGKSDLARFSLDLSWARAVSDSARSRAYPSPPMSGSPPLPPRRNPDASDRGHGSYGSTGQDVFRGPQTSQSEHIERTRGPPIRGYQEQQPHPPATYPPYRLDDMPSQVHYQQQRSQMQQQQLPQHSYPPQPQAPFTTTGPPIGEVPEYSSPKAQRKTKGHVASACVPCKRAHLRCDAQRPCSRCLSNGKEDTCVDVQHKKRGRPRLRDEREPRYEALGPGGPNYPQPPPESMRRPLSLYGPADTAITTSFGDALQRSGSYRVLKSQGGGMGGPLAPRLGYMEHQSPADANVYAGSMPPTPRMLPSQEPICAYLSMEMQIAKATPGFGETVGMQSVVSRKFHDIVSANDRDKVFRLQRVFEDERREREPNYLPPIYLNKYEEDRVIDTVGFGPDVIGQVRTDRSEVITFQAPDGQQRTCQVRFGLAKKDSTYFIIAVVNIPATPQTYHQPSSSPFSRESYSRESQYGYQAQPAYQQNPAASSFMPSPFGDPQGNVPTYRTPGPLGQNIPQSTNVSSFAQPPPRPEYPHGQNPYQTPRSELSQVQGQTQAQPPIQPQSQRQRDLQLPPIRDQRDQRGEPSSMGRGDRGRFDIGGLLEHPDPSGRGR